MGELNLAHAIAMLECSNSIENGMLRGRCRIQPVPDDDRQRRPNVQRLPYGGFFCADNVKAQTSWGGEDNMPPSPAHMREPVPRTRGAHVIHYICPVEVENDQEDIIWERVDCYTACTNNSDSFTGFPKRTYVDIAWKVPSSSVQNAFRSLVLQIRFQHGGNEAQLYGLGRRIEDGRLFENVYVKGRWFSPL